MCEIPNYSRISKLRMNSGIIAPIHFFPKKKTNVLRAKESSGTLKNLFRTS
jgi:hypothetical protein